MISPARAMLVIAQTVQGAFGALLASSVLAMPPLHSYTTAFLYSALIFVVAAVIAGLVLPRGNMRTLSGLAADGTQA